MTAEHQDPVRAPGAAPPAVAGHSRWRKFWLVVKVIELRLRFIALMTATGLVFAYWDTIWNKVDRWQRPHAAQHVAAAAGFEFFCPMHPFVVRDDPGKCPICGMPLARRKQGEKGSTAEGMGVRVQLSPVRVAQAGIHTSEVAYAPLDETVTTLGEVVHDATRYALISSKIQGMTRVEKLYVNYIGRPVKAGEPLAEVYSAELYTATRELLIAQNMTRDAASSKGGRPLLKNADELLRGATAKLKLWGITDAQINAILARGQADYRMQILAPISGHVTRKNVVEGQIVPEGFEMFEVSDLSHLWVKAQIYEDQIALVREGQAVEARVPAYPSETFPGRVAFIDPELDPVTRTLGVRYDLVNLDHRLRPGMYATVTLRTPITETPAYLAHAGGQPAPGHGAALTAEQQKVCPVTGLKLGAMGEPVLVEVEGRKVWTCCGSCPPKIQAQPARYLAHLVAPPQGAVLSVPESAIIDTGDRKLVYVEAEPGVYEAREVVLGPRSGDRYPVLEGLAPGDRVATAGAFLIDAESRLSGSSSGSHAHPAPSAPPPRTEHAPGPAGHRTAARPPDHIHE